jgi:hypothetical protein
MMLSIELTEWLKVEPTVKRRVEVDVISPCVQGLVSPTQNKAPSDISEGALW